MVLANKKYKVKHGLAYSSYVKHKRQSTHVVMPSHLSLPRLPDMKGAVIDVMCLKGLIQCFGFCHGAVHHKLGSLELAFIFEPR
jgi:hypothetical protein